VSRTSKIVGIVFLALLLALGGCAGLIFSLMHLLRSSQPARDGLAALTSNPEAVALIGEPMNEGLWLSGSISLTNDDGEAELSIPVSGPLGAGTLRVVGFKTEGQWRYDVLRFISDSGPTLDLQSTVAP
jgi:hypothetical protein